MLLDAEQKKELAQYILEQENDSEFVRNPYHASPQIIKNALTEIQEGELYLCLEHRIVRVRERVISLTGKEFDILALLAANPKRVFTYEFITDIVWKEDYNFYSRKAIHNHVSKLRKKLRFEPNLPNYIESVSGIGYKFEHLPAP
ncbi:winged helix-turn-helix domain-containing protein [Enterocloster clostridioformis]|uniref:winged helix-turn-helix domain-containing protein n=1 Tax=Enterocloster clostridioformis TaxID=1531 RepID=UPI0003FD247A|nr:winged helix-turn-helix domain-containing protein [Enterocloster clostridioformis]